MNLVLYSGGQNISNHKLHDAIGQLATKRAIKRRAPLSFTYVPFTSDGASVFFNRASRRYARFGFKEFNLLPADRPVNPGHLKKCFKTDVIYLAGGNTFYFLHHLRKSGLLSRIREFAAKGGVVAGLSAGAIIMTPNINLAGYPEFDRDENEVRLKNLKSLGLVNFEFFAHHSQSARLRKALEAYSRRSGKTVYGVEDGGGIVLEKAKRTFFGKIWMYHQGHRVLIL